MVKTRFSLEDLREGQKATIRDIDSTNATADRLLDLGFVPGTEITAVQHAPMGDPTTFQVRGYRIGLRKSEARLVTIDPHPDE